MTEHKNGKKISEEHVMPPSEITPAPVSAENVGPVSTGALDALPDQVAEIEDELNHGVQAAPGFVITFWSNNQHGFDAMVSPEQGAGVTVWDQRIPSKRYCLNPDRFTIDAAGHLTWGGGAEIAAVETQAHFQARHDRKKARMLAELPTPKQTRLSIDGTLTDIAEEINTIGYHRVSEVDFSEE